MSNDASLAHSKYRVVDIFMVLGHVMSLNKHKQMFRVHFRLGFLLWLVVLTSALSPTTFAQGNFESVASGTWNSAATWQLVSGTDPNGFPDANDNVTIKNGDTVTAGTRNRDCANLVIDAGGTLWIDANRHVRINADPGSATVNGTVIMSNTGRLRERGSGTRTLITGDGGKVTISGDASNPQFDIFDFHVNSTFEYIEPGNQTVQSGIIFGNLILGGSGKKTVAPLPSDTAFTCAGKLTVGSGVTFDVSANILYINFDGDVENNGTIDAAVGTTVLWMRGSTWTNNGTYLPSISPGFGQIPTTTFVNTQIGGSTPNQLFYNIMLEDSVQAQTSMSIEKNLEIDSGATFNAGIAIAHQVKGDWINNGIFDCGTATVSLVGTSNQSIAASTFCHLIVDNPAGVTLAGDVSIAPGGSLTLTNGNIITGIHTLGIDETSASALVVGSNRILGTISRAIAFGSVDIYYFADSKSFVVPNGINNPSNLTVTAYPNANPPNLASTADTNKIAKRYYTITATGGAPGFIYTLRLPYEQTEVRGTEANYVFWKNPGTGWLNAGSLVVDTSDNYVQQIGLTGFSDWAIAENDAALPIQLAYFNAAVIANSNSVHVTWRTITETNNYGFYVQQSVDNTSSFVDLPNSFVPGQGTTLIPHDYSWTHHGVPQGTYYYRLKQVDLDGTIHFTEAVQVIVDGVTSADDKTVPAVFSLTQNYPNPFNPSTTITFTVEKRGQTTLSVFNLIGQQIATLFSGDAEPGRVYTTRFDATSLANGIYFYKLVSNEQSSIKKMILLK
ncbi:MAG: T9SS type A sorting domain-containing protein [Ignavibacteria bacterium]|nr:T9SS type A sorting domain-containing protein [Ignavibacteria bacterium]